MRVTSNTFPTSLSEQLSRLNLRQTRLNEQAATGQRIRNPEDDPSAMHRVMDMQRDMKVAGQYERNVSQLLEQNTSSYGVIKSLKSLISRAQELSTQAGGLRSQDELNIYAEEVNQLIKTGVQAVNTKFRGDFLFSGTKTDQPPFVESTNSNGDTTAVTYQGNTENANAEIADGMTLSVGIPGANTSGAGQRGLVTDTRSGADLFNHLIALRDALRAGNTTVISNTINGDLAKDEDNLLIHVGVNGALQGQLQTAQTLAKNDNLSLQASISGESDVDLSQTILQLTQTQTAYQAALKSGGQILGQSLLDYLK